MIVFAIIAAILGFALTSFAIWPAVKQRPQWLGPLAILAVILVAGVVYLTGGQPGSEGQPYAERAISRIAADPSTLSRDEREERWRDIIRRDDTDANAWAQLGRMLARSERELEGVNAFQRSLRLDLNARTLSDLGQTFINLNEGQVTPEAVSAFEEARRLDDTLPEPSFFLGLAAFQSGRIDEAETIWLDLIARLDDRPAYRILIAEQTFQLLSQIQVDSAAVAQAAEDENFDPESRMAAMVGRLQTRVDSGDAGFADWMRLIRVYGRTGDAQAAAETIVAARQEFSDNEGAIVILEILTAALVGQEENSP